MNSSFLLSKDIRPNGYYFNILFILYYLFLAPLINKFILFGEKNFFVAFMGIAVYITEFFAFDFKIKMIRLRGYSEALRLKKETGKEISMSGPGGVLMYAIVIRFLLRIGFMMTSMYALFGNPEVPLYTVMTVLLVIVVLLEVGICAYTFSQSGLVENISSEDSGNKPWIKKFLPKFDTGEYRQKEFLSDIVLHLYAFMIITAFWNPINESGKNIINATAPLEDSALYTGIILFFIYTVLAFISLPAIRLAYWTEESVMAFTRKDKWKLRGSFILTALVVASPVIQQYFKVYLWK